MNDAAILERRYRRLLRWYPPSFRHDSEGEMLGVLMAGARDGKRWPSAAEAADVLRGALRMRLRLPPPGSKNRGWSDAWAAFSVLAPVFLLVANLVVVLVPAYFPRVQSRDAGIAPLRLSWVTPMSYQLIAFQAVIVLAVLAGRRWVALAATLAAAVAWGATQTTGPEPVTLVTWAVYMLETVALLASPGPRRGRGQLTWGHGVVLVLAVAAVKLSSVTWFAVKLPGSQLIGNPRPRADMLLIIAAGLAVVTVIAPVALRQSGRMSLLIAALLYPYATELVSMVVSGGNAGDLLPRVEFTPIDAVILFGLPLVMAVLAALVAARGRLASAKARPVDQKAP